VRLEGEGKLLVPFGLEGEGKLLVGFRRDVGQPTPTLAQHGRTLYFSLFPMMYEAAFAEDNKTSTPACRL
jgi:hypothetical protein